MTKLKNDLSEMILKRKSLTDFKRLIFQRKC